MRCLALGCIVVFTALAQGATGGARQYLGRDDAWFGSAEAKTIAGNILSWQSELGGWPKNVDTTVPYAGSDRTKDLKPTFDNRATTDELRFLARMYAATGDANYRAAVERGVDYVLKAQYPSGGWPQFYPPDRAYHRYITFNDNAMVRVMKLVRELYSSPRFEFLDDARKQRAREAFGRGIGCILKCQVRVDGKLTAWCAQHDEIDYSPRPGRAFELVSLSGGETVGIVRLLMSIEKPSAEVKASIEAAVAWLEAVQIRGIKVIQVPDTKAPKGMDRRVVEDPQAPPIWARFYEIATNRPFFCDRDGVKRYALSEIGYERRNGYAWYGDWPRRLVEKEYSKWKREHGE